MFKIFSKSSSKPKSVIKFNALKAKPHQCEFVKREHVGGKLHVAVNLSRPLWQRALGADKMFVRTFALDSYGEAVYTLCNGKNTVDNIIDSFANKHKISLPEAEVGVSTFLKMLMAKGLIYMEIERENYEQKK